MFHDQEEENDFKAHRDDLFNRATLAIPNMGSGEKPELAFVIEQLAQVHARLDRIVRWVEKAKTDG